MKPIWSLLTMIISAGVALPAEAQEIQDAGTTPTVAELNAKPFSGQPSFRVEIRYPGVYRITGEQLANAGVDLRSVRPEWLSLQNEGTSLPIHVVTKEPGVFAPDDYLEFIGDSPRGTYSYYKPDNLHNIYFLGWSTPGANQFQPVTAPRQQPREAIFRNVEHREKDFQFRYSALPPGQTDNFFWLFYQAGQDPKGIFPLYLDFPGFARSMEKPVELTFRVFGVTNVPSLKPGHQFSFHYGDYDLGAFAFDGIGYHEFSTSIPASKIKPRQRLTLHTPPGREDAVDQVALDSVRVSYPRSLDAAGSDYFVFTNEFVGQEAAGAPVLVGGLKPGSRIYDLQQNLVYTASSTTASVAFPDTPTTFVAVSPSGSLDVDKLAFLPPDSGLSDVDDDIETLVFFHPDLQCTADTYTRYRQSSGMKVKSVRVTDIYDALNDGFISDTVLKRYVRYAASRSLKLRYLVLFGDSTFDYREARTFDEENPPRILIPIHWVYSPATTWSGGYQDDNWYGSLSDRYRPDLSVGRIPAVSDEQGMEYIRKLIEHETLKRTRDDKALFISSVEKSFQELVLEVQKQYQERFTTVTLLFPEKEQATKEVHRLQDEISSGVQLLYYVGHGGSLVWRVGPTDFQQQKDLFTPADVKRLTNAGHYPVIACSSCYTTSFDQTGSLGEALILQPNAGAIAVLGSPWKATVHESHAFNSRLFKYYFDPKVKRLGEAALLAHRDITPPGQQQPSFQSFTLLGDPCLEVPRR